MSNISDDITRAELLSEPLMLDGACRPGALLTVHKIDASSLVFTAVDVGGSTVDVEVTMQGYNARLRHRVRNVASVGQAASLSLHTPAAPTGPPGWAFTYHYTADDHAVPALGAANKSLGVTCQSNWRVGLSAAHAGAACPARAGTAGCCLTGANATPATALRIDCAASAETAFDVNFSRLI